jgi:hypothetical protein
MVVHLTCFREVCYLNYTWDLDIFTEVFHVFSVTSYKCWDNGFTYEMHIFFHIPITSLSVNILEYYWFVNQQMWVNANVQWKSRCQRYYQDFTRQWTHILILSYIQCPVALCQYFRILFLKWFPVRIVMNMNPVLNYYEAININWRLFKWHKTRLQSYWQHDSKPCIWVDTWQSTWMSSSLTNGLLIIICRICYCDH